LKRGYRTTVFENILGQKRLISQIRSEVEGKNFPGAVLFYGEPYSGKLSTALELARVLTCSGSGEWSCDCNSCRKHRVLDHPYLLMLGSRYFVEEIAASGDALVRNRNAGSRYLFIRAVRKLTRRLDPLLWEGQEQKLGRIQSTLTKLEEELESIYPEAELPEDSDLRQSVEKITALTMDIEKIVPRDNIPIDQVRAVNSWVHTTGSTSAKVLIFENCDKMGASSRNALLKTLEEPPPATYFILISSRKGRIMPTILSRVRQYHFPERDHKATAEVLEKIYRTDPGEYEDLNSFFLTWKGVPLKKLHTQGEYFFNYVWGDAEWEPEKLEDFLQDKNLSTYFVPFLQTLSSILHGYLKNGFEKTLSKGDFIDQGRGGGNSADEYGEDGRGVRRRRLSFSLLERWNGEIREALLQFEQYNQAPDLLLESLLYSMKESL
jgi:DNA polymerase-3 subunit gamma/tau